MVRKSLLASTLLAFLACDSSSANNPSPPPIAEGDAGADGGNDGPSAPTGVTVTARYGSAPMSGLRVLFHDAEGAVIGDEVTDANGKAKPTLDIKPAMVTVYSAGVENVQPWLVTYLGVTDGDQLTVNGGWDDNRGGYKYKAIFPANVPAGTSEVSASVASSYDECLDAASPESGSVTFFFGPGCSNATNPVLLSATAGDSISPTHYALRRNVPLPTDTAPDVDFNAAPAVEWTPRSTVKVTAVFAPLRCHQIVDGAAFMITTDLYTDNSLSFPVASAADGFQCTAEKLAYVDGEKWAWRVRGVKRQPPAVGQFELATDSAPKALLAPTLDVTDPARPVVSVDPALGSNDGVYVRIRYTAVENVQEAGETEGVEVEGNWTFVVPPSTPSFKAPVLPEDLHAHRPAKSIIVDTVAGLKSTLLGSYGAFKAVPAGPRTSGFGKVLPADGTVFATSIHAVVQDEP